MHRVTAITRLGELIDRAKFWIDHLGVTLLGVERIVLFGSLASGAEHCGDIDLLWIPAKRKLQDRRRDCSESQWQALHQSYLQFRPELGLTKPPWGSGLIGLVMHDFRRFMIAGNGRFQVIETYAPFDQLAGSAQWINLIKKDRIIWQPHEDLPDSFRLSEYRHLLLLAKEHSRFFPEGKLSEGATFRTLGYMPDRVRESLLGIRPDLRRLWDKGQWG